MEALQVLKNLDLGNSIAEFDESLENYFLETDLFRRLFSGEVDIIAGDKGTGKTALFKILHQRFPSIAEMDNIEVVPAFNIAGSSIFQRINEGDVLSEGQYQTMWKAYFVSLAGNWLLTVFEDDFTDSMKELDELLRVTGLRSADDEPSTIFSTVINLFRRLTSVKAVEGGGGVSAEGLPIVTGRVEFGDPSEPQSRDLVEHDEAFVLLNRSLAEVDLQIWLALDRLDEAFAGLPAAEIPALRALFRTYLDLVPYENLRLKLFVRKDLFGRIIQGGFVNLTHVNARKQEIVWDDESLHYMLFLRMKDNPIFIEMLGADADSPDDVFSRVFTEQIDQGERKPTTWRWITGRIRDGNDVKPPRNLIDLVKKAQDSQVRREEREHRPFEAGVPLIQPEAVKAALSGLSKQRIEDTLLAEAGDEATLVERFRNSKAEHNRETLAGVLGSSGEDLDRHIRFLREIGFLELVGSNYKVPILYRDGLGITQGRAFTGAPTGAEDDDG